MPGLLSLPPELLHEIIQMCPQQGRCRLRATCKVLSQLADPIVFRRLSLFTDEELPHITEHQIFTIATRSSKACEFTKEMGIFLLGDDKLQASGQSLPYFGYCDDLKVHLPTAISALRNLTCFSYEICYSDPDWLVNSLMQAVARLPRLTEVCIRWVECEARIPVGLFSNLSRLSISCEEDTHPSFFISQMATVIANSPQLRFLNVGYLADGVPPSLSDLFAKLSTKNPLCLEHLALIKIDATVTQATLPHLAHLTLFEFIIWDEDLAARVWTSFLVNHVNLTDVVIQGIVTKESVSYLLSLSGLRTLSVDNIVDMENVFFEEVLAKHVNSLQTLQLTDWIIDHSKVKSIMSCLKLRDLAVRINGKDGATVQLLLDTVAHLPELKILHVCVSNSPPGWLPGPASFHPKPGLRYVKELEIELRIEYSESSEINRKWYVLEDDMGQTLRYREIPWLERHKSWA